jgi:hypothetical protein
MKRRFGFSQGEDTGSTTRWEYEAKPAGQRSQSDRNGLESDSNTEDPQLSRAGSEFASGKSAMSPDPRPWFSERCGSLGRASRAR